METLRVEIEEGRSDGVGEEKRGHCGATDLSPTALQPPCNPIFLHFLFSLFPVLSGPFLFYSFLFFFFSN